MTHVPVMLKAKRLMLKELVLKRVQVLQQKALIAVLKRQVELMETRKMVRDAAASK